MPPGGPDAPRGRYIAAVSDVEPTMDADSGWSKGRVFGVTVGILLAAGMVILLVLGLARSDEKKQLFEVGIENNNPPPAPEVTLPVLYPGGSVGPKDAEFSLSSLRGKPVLVNLWASWCPPCRDEAPILERIWQRNRAKGLTVLGIDTQDGTGDALGFIRKYHVTYPSLRDGTDTTQGKFGTTQLPESFVIDGSGKVRMVFRGGLTTGSERQINAFLDGKRS